MARQQPKVSKRRAKAVGRSAKKGAQGEQASSASHRVGSRQRDRDDAPPRARGDDGASYDPMGYGEGRGREQR